MTGHQMLCYLLKLKQNIIMTSWLAHHDDVIDYDVIRKTNLSVGIIEKHFCQKPLIWGVFGCPNGIFGFLFA